MIYLIANWKSHHTITQSLLWLEQFQQLQPTIPPHITPIICLPFTDIPEFNRRLSDTNFPLITAAQNVSPFPAGKHTGEVTAQMLSELVSYCLIGHSERRQQFKETNQLVAQKAQQLLHYRITPIICLDTPQLEDQIKALIAQDVNPEDCLFAYEPISAIGTGQAISPQIANQFATNISLLTSPQTKVLYGGSVTADNVSNFISQPHLHGVLVGTDSLTPEDLHHIINSTPKQ